MLRFKYIVIYIFLFTTINAQEGINYAKKDSLSGGISNINYASLKLPSLDILFENAKKNPSIEIIDNEKKIQKLLLSNKKKDWLNFFSVRGGYSHGVTDNYGTQTDILTPVFYQYTGIEQNYWNVGGNVNIPFDKLFNLRGEIKTQKLNVEKQELQKQIVYDNLKQQIAHLYVDIQSKQRILLRSSEYLAFYKGASATTEEDFRNRNTTIDNLADLKRREFESNTNFENIITSINEEIIYLEIISKTVIIPKF